MYTKEELKQIYIQLSKPFPEEAVERTDSRNTKKGYNTTGIKYQFIVNRLNEVLGIGGFQVDRQFEIREKQSKSGNTLYDASCDLTLRLGHWEAGSFKTFAEAVATGGHVSNNISDAKKGAFTNGFKKAAAFFSCGWQAYGGVIDDDNKPLSANGNSGYENNGFSNNITSANFGVVNGNGNGNGRITQKQLDKMNELVSQISGTDWNSFTDYVKEKFNRVPAYLSKHEASSLITELIGYANNGAANEG